MNKMICNADNCILKDCIHNILHEEYDSCNDICAKHNHNAQCVEYLVYLKKLRKCKIEIIDENLKIV